VAAAPVLLLLVEGWQRRWMADDGLIHLRVVENVLQGHGFVFNAGERVEASTSVLWVALLAVLRAPRLIGLETIAVVTGLLCSAGGLFLATRGAALLWRRRGERSWLLPAGAIVVAVLPPMWDFATSGLETGLVFLWLGVSFLLLARLTTDREPAWGRYRAVGLVVSAGPLIRPDLALFTGAFLLAALLLARRAGVPGRRLVLLAVFGLVLPFAFQMFRMGYYGALVPTTALAKEASRAWWSQGWLYLADFLGTYGLLIPLVIAAVFLAAGVRSWARDRASDRLLVAAAPVLAGLADALYVTRVGGDFMHGRLLLPALFAVMMPVAVVAARSWWRGAALVAVLSWAVVCGTQLRVPYVVGPDGIADERAFYSISAGHRNPVQVDAYAPMVLFADGQEARRLAAAPGRHLGWRTDRARPVYTSMPLSEGVAFRDAFVASNLGITGVVARPSVHIIDPSGLADPFASRVLVPTRGRPGHEKSLPLAWVIARFGDPAAPVPGGVSPSDVEAARRALRCGALHDLEVATTAPLTPSRFVRNIRLAIQLRAFRFPSDPNAAEARFCGR
jgi:arabinofuranosyltransferase